MADTLTRFAGRRAPIVTPLLAAGLFAACGGKTLAVREGVGFETDSGADEDSGAPTDNHDDGESLQRDDLVRAHDNAWSPTLLLVALRGVQVDHKKSPPRKIHASPGSQPRSASQWIGSISSSSTSGSSSGGRD